MPVLIEDCKIPFSLSDRFYADLRYSFEKGLNSLLKGLSKNKSESFDELEEIIALTGIDRHSSQIQNLIEVYSDHKLPDIDAKLADLFQKRQNLSPLIVAKYLKIGLGKTFLSTVRDVL